MFTYNRSVAIAAIAAGCAFTAALSASLARADQTAFIGPAGWSHSDPSTGDSTVKIERWHLPGDDLQSLTFIVDPNTPYTDAMAAIQKNFTTNHLKASVDKDLACKGVQGHVIEFATGPDGHKIIINRILLPNGTGVESITYSRGEGNPFDDDVKKSIAIFCGATS
jgi:hypothetical protein